MVKNSGKLSVGFCYDDSLDRADGVSNQVKTLGAWLSAQGHDVSYFVGQTKINDWAGDPIFSLSRNLRVSFNGNKVATPLFASSRKIKRALNQRNLDVVHVQVPYSPLMAQKLIHRLNATTALVGTFHILPTNFIAARGVSVLRFVYSNSLKRFQTMLAVSPAAAQFASATLSTQPVVIPNTLNIKNMRASKPNNIPNHIVFLGRLVKRKGCEELIRAFAILKTKILEATLTIAGDGPERTKLETLVKQSGLESSVKFVGFIDEKDKPDILASAAVACFPSLGGESFGIVLIEAMAAGAGVVLGGNNPGYTCVLGERPETLVDSRNSLQFAKQLERFLTDAKLIEDVHSWQQKHVKKYDIEVVGPKILKVYVQAIAKRRQTIDN